ncbi:hypothetical protein CPB86DRAFT_869980 [Serendipita vermifera]|nr:hypothetical protein CPB86DRAFT_869980 [Serendipita vermifera]
MLLIAKKDWPDMGRSSRAYLAVSMAEVWTISSAVIRDGSSSIVLPTHLIELILDLVIPGDGVDTIDARYLAAVRGEPSCGWDRQWNDALCRVLRMVTQHLILQTSWKYDSLSDATKELELFSSFMDSKRLDLIEEKDNFIWAMLNKSTSQTEDQSVRMGKFLCGGLYSRPFELAWVDLILAVDDFVARLDPHSFHVYSKAIRFINHLYKLRLIIDDSFDWNSLAHVRDPCLAWIASWHCPGDVQFQALIHPNFSEWNATTEQEFIPLFDLEFYSPSHLDSNARITFLRALILEGPSNPRITALDSFPWNTWWTSDDENCNRVFASPVLRVVLEQSIKSGNFSILSLLTMMAKFQWFYGEFSQANGLEWLPLIALNPIHPEDRTLWDNALAEILVDHILSLTVSHDIQEPLSSSYHYSQSIGQSDNPLDHHRLANLRTALLWVLNNSTNVHDAQDRADSSSPLVFDPPVLEREAWPTVGDVRSFDFVKDMSGEAWEDYVTRLQVLIMGTSLGGLKPGPLQDRNRFCQDPDGFCGRI